jgi:hypothetical protein
MHRLAALLGLALVADACTSVCPKDQVEATRRFVREVCAVEPLALPIFLREGAAWARVDLAATPVTEGVPVFLYADGPMFDPRAAVSLDELAARLKEEVETARALAGNTGRPWAGRALLVIAADVPVENIPPVVAVLFGAGFTEVGFVAEAGGGPAIPPLPDPGVVAEVDARAATIPEDMLPKLEARRQLLLAEVARCPAIDEALAQVGDAPYAERCTRAGESVALACEACRCSSDIARAVSLVMLVFRPEVLLVERRTAADAPPVAARAGERWGEVAPRLFAAPDPARLEVAPGG